MEKANLIVERENRLQFTAVYTAVKDWLKVAESNVREDYNGIDYEIVDQNLALHKVLHFCCCTPQSCCAFAFAFTVHS